MTCKDCKWFNGKSNHAPGDGQGKCQLMPLPLKCNGDHWPTTYATEWCGSFKHKNKVEKRK